MTYLEAYRAAVEADDAWSAELERVYGRAAGDARYDYRGCNTRRLNNLWVAKRDADRLLRLHWDTA